MRRRCGLYLALALCVAAGQGCLACSELSRSVRGVMPLSRDAEANRAEVLKRVPVGTPLEDAKKTLAANDFALSAPDGKPPSGEVVRYYRAVPRRSWGDIYPGGILVHLTHADGKVAGVRIEWVPG